MFHDAAAPTVQLVHRFREHTARRRLGHERLQRDLHGPLVLDIVPEPRAHVQREESSPRHRRHDGVHHGFRDLTVLVEGRRPREGGLVSVDPYLETLVADEGRRRRPRSADHIVIGERDVDGVRTENDVRHLGRPRHLDDSGSGHGGVHDLLLLLTLALPRPGIPRDGTVEGVPRLLETDLRRHRNLLGGNGRTAARRCRPDPMLKLALAIETRHVLRGGGGGGRHGVLALRR